MSVSVRKSYFSTEYPPQHTCCLKLFLTKYTLKENLWLRNGPPTLSFSKVQHLGVLPYPSSPSLPRSRLSPTRASVLSYKALRCPFLFIFIASHLVAVGTLFPAETTEYSFHCFHVCSFSHYQRHSDVCKTKIRTCRLRLKTTRSYTVSMRYCSLVLACFCSSRTPHPHFLCPSHTSFPLVS